MFCPICVQLGLNSRQFRIVCPTKHLDKGPSSIEMFFCIKPRSGYSLRKTAQRQTQINMTTDCIYSWKNEVSITFALILQFLIFFSPNYPFTLLPSFALVFFLLILLD